MERNKKLFNLTVVAALLFIFLFILIQRNAAISRRQIEAAVSSGTATSYCRLTMGNVIKSPTYFVAVDINSPDGYFLVQPGLSLAPEAVSKRLNIWVGRINLRDILALNPSGGAAGQSIVDVIERILLFKLAEIDKRINAGSERLEKIGKDESRGPSSFLYQVTSRELQDLKSDGRRLFYGLNLLYRLTGVGPALPCWFIGLESLQADQPLLPYQLPGGPAIAPDDTGTGDTGTGDTDTGFIDYGDTGTGFIDYGDTGTSDTGTGDTGTSDTGTIDTGTGDIGTSDTGTIDTGTGDIGTGGTGTIDTDTGFIDYGDFIP